MSWTGMFHLVLLWHWMTIVTGCQCGRDMSLEDAMKFPTWVSHVKVLERTKGRTQVEPVTYRVKHVEEFKYAQLPLPPTIITQGRAALCGLPHLEVDEHYLLAGKCSHTTGPVWPGFNQSGHLTIEKCAQPYVEVLDGVGIGKAPSRWRQLSDKNKQFLQKAKQLYLSSRKPDL